LGLLAATSKSSPASSRATDVFDLNRYANSTRTPFLNWGLFQNTAWDFAADTRGYTNGFTIAYVPHIGLFA
jgi:hypothetical protein